MKGRGGWEQRRVFRDRAEAGEALALMWLARAATHGHALAREQLAALLPR